MGEEHKQGGGGNMNDATQGSKEEKKKENEEQGDDEIIVLKVDMHCDACAKKVFRALTGFPGVEDVAVDRKMNKVVVKGKTADPTNLCHRILKKTGRKAHLVSRPPDVDIKDTPKDQQPLRVITVVLGVRMHCEACAHITWKRIRKFKGVESVEIDVTNDQVRVKGVIADPVALAEYVTKRTRKQASIIAVEDVTDKKSDDQPEATTADKKQETDEKEDNQKSGKQLLEDDKMMRSQLYRSNEYYWSPSNYNYNYNYNYMDHNTSTSVNYHPPIFSDENPNACSII